MPKVTKTTVQIYLKEIKKILKAFPISSEKIQDRIQTSLEAVRQTLFHLLVLVKTRTRFKIIEPCNRVIEQATRRSCELFYSTNRLFAIESELQKFTRPIQEIQDTYFTEYSRKIWPTRGFDIPLFFVAFDAIYRSTYRIYKEMIVTSLPSGLWLWCIKGTRVFVGSVGEYSAELTLLADQLSFISDLNYKISPRPLRSLRWDLTFLLCHTISDIHDTKLCSIKSMKVEVRTLLTNVLKTLEKKSLTSGRVAKCSRKKVKRVLSFDNSTFRSNGGFFENKTVLSSRDNISFIKTMKKSKKIDLAMLHLEIMHVVLHEICLSCKLAALLDLDRRLAFVQGFVAVAHVVHVQQKIRKLHRPTSYMLYWLDSKRKTWMSPHFGLLGFHFNHTLYNTLNVRQMPRLFSATRKNNALSVKPEDVCLTALMRNLNYVYANYNLRKMVHCCYSDPKWNTVGLKWNLFVDGNSSCTSAMLSTFKLRGFLRCNVDFWGNFIVKNSVLSGDTEMISSLLYTYLEKCRIYERFLQKTLNDIVDCAENEICPLITFKESVMNSAYIVLSDKVRSNFSIIG